MHVIEIENGITGYGQVVDFVLKNGIRRCPRGICTIDVGPVCVYMHDINWSLPLHVGRSINRKIAAAEAIQLIGGFSDPLLLDYASPNFKQFAEPDGRYHGAYGRRISDQLSQVIKKLNNDIHTRQAVITLWDPFLDNQPNKRDYPCTVMLHFAIIDAKLELTVTMRSQDIWLGAPYDWFQFTQLQHTVCTLLNTKPGPYRHITLSTHLYERNIDATTALVDPLPQDRWEDQPRGVGVLGDRMYELFARARQLTYGVNMPDVARTDSERWYVDQFSGFPTFLG